MIKDENVRYFCHATPDGRTVKVVDPKTGEQFRAAMIAIVDITAKETETDEGHFIEYVLKDDSGSDRVKCSEWEPMPGGGQSRYMIMRTSYLDFDVVDCQTNEVLARHRQAQPTQSRCENEG